MTLKEEWLGLFSEDRRHDVGEASWKTIEKAYSEPHRHYHTLAHLVECFEEFSRYPGLTQRPEPVKMALFFHDFIYEPGRHRGIQETNESRSATEWMLFSWENKNSLPWLRYGDRSRVQEMILESTHDQNGIETSSDPLLFLFLDLDLLVLGKDPPRFDEYEAQVRREYAFVPEVAFKEARARILRSFLARDVIYRTPSISRRYESMARNNLKRSLALLETTP